MIRKEKRSPGELSEVVRHVSELFLFLLLCVALVTHPCWPLSSPLFMSRLSDLETGWASSTGSQWVTQGVCPVHDPGVAGSQSQPQQITWIGLIMMPNCERAVQAISLYNIRAIIFYKNQSTYIYKYIHILSYTFTFPAILYYTEYRMLAWISCNKPAAAQASAFQQSTSDLSQEEHSWKAQLLQHFRLWPHCSEKQDFISLRPLICKSMMDWRWEATANTSLELLCSPSVVVRHNPMPCTKCWDTWTTRMPASPQEDLWIWASLFHTICLLTPSYNNDGE